MKNKWFWISILLIISVVGFLFFNSSKSEKYTIEETKVIKNDLVIPVRASGIAVPRNRLEIKPPIAGRVESVLVAEGDVVPRGRIIAWMSSTERAALLDAARTKSAEEIKQWEDFYKPTPVISPLRGLVIAANIRAGQTVTQQDILYVLSDSLMVQAKVDETDLSKIKIGQKAKVSVDSFSNVIVAGKVSHIAYEAITENNVTLYNVDLELTPVPEFLRSGMSITLDFILSEQNDVLLLKSEFLKQNSNKNFVLVKDNGKLIEKEVGIGTSDDMHTVIEWGLNEGEVVFRKKKNVDKKTNPSSSPFSTPRVPKR
ncbi:efflux RND transporter periplasmic adaptor subunit [Leptospira sp. 96542]|nr:efflux RND transporter periplasmic adaptor subunit [Leptospira sp. 96542]